MGVASAETCRAWRLRNKGRVKAINRKYREAKQEKIAEYNRLWKIDNKARTSAQRKAQYAVKCGTIIKEPCLVCGEMESEMHHDDYSRPLDIKWLCASHHQYLHSHSAIKKAVEKTDEGR